ncbi:hypothetical protein KNU71_gp120 [Streptomyces phage Braelyn]|jgi:hypothetical protein|uniref:Uncharacterized protein n=1 Tax=Streptomyces phage Braelyn TaxID=2593356 RepID=A0A514U228_9CAUD|nr:hypothetical protein KNU71_gp120 [Streptomyces phage Braelyn]QDK02997.1 hypothetical protein SEA_BRAELYN_174 [Streptomyces phage Braelyn]
MMQIEIHYSFGEGPFIVGGEIDEIPFELKYYDGEAELVVLTSSFVLYTGATYNPLLGKLDHLMTGQLIFNLARQLDSEF